MFSRPAFAIVPAPLVAFALLLFALPSRAQEPAGADGPPAPNVLLVTLEATRADRLGCYGHESAHTPRIDALAAEGVRFERAYTHAPLTLPAHASLFSGRTPLEHGVHDDARHALGPQPALLAELFRAKGYRTGAFVGSIELKQGFGLARGFEVFGDDLGAPDDLKALKRKRSAREVARAAAEWLAAEDERPFFCWVQLADARAPLDPPRDMKELTADSYDASLAAMDAAVGGLLDTLAQRDSGARTLVVVVGSMGQGLGEHGEATHGALVHDSTLRVPLIVRAPGASAAGTASPLLVGHADLAPSLTELLGWDGLAGATGESFAGALRGEADIASERQVYFESEYTALRFGWSTLRGLVRGEWKLVRGPEPALFHITADPAESQDLAAERPELVEELLAALAARVAAGRERAAPVAAADAAELKRLSGIDTEPVVGSSSGELREGAGVDPHGRMAAVAGYLEALDASYVGLPMAMAEPLEKAVADSEETPALHVLLAIAYERSRRFEEAKQHLARALELDPQSATANYYMARMQIQTGHPENAEPYYQLAAELEPGSHRAQLAMAQRLVQEERLAEAVPYLERVCALAPEQKLNWQQLLFALRHTGRWAESASAAQRAEQQFPDDLFFPNYRAWVMATAPEESARDPKQALAVAEALAERTEMQDAGILDTLAAAQAADGDFAAAKKTLQKAILIAHQHQFDELLAEMRGRLELYQKGAPYRDS